MKTSEVFAMLKTLSFPVEFDHVKDKTFTPFGVVNYSQPNNFAADNMIFAESGQFTLRVYMDEISSALIQEVKSLLNANELPFSMDDITWIDDAKAYEITFNFGIMEVVE